MSTFTKLPPHERKMAERRCHHRFEHMHARKGSVTWTKNLGWSRYWRHEIRVQMNDLRRDAKGKGKGGWHKDGRGWRYQTLAGAYTGKACKTPLAMRGNRVTGGTPRERLKAAALRAAELDAQGRRHSFYSQSGAWTVKYGITGEPWGYRSDCSQFVTSIYFACGLADPNGNNYNGGFTGTLVSHGRAISRSELQPGDLIIYGDGNGHHVEMYVGPGEKTIGHGSRPVDAGVIDLLSGPKHYRSYV